MSYLAEIIFLAIVSILLGIKLFSLLGQRREREDSFKNTTSELGAKSPTKTIKDVEVKIDNTMTPELQLPLLDKSFDKARFLDNAKEAFKIILDAYTKGDTHTLSKLLNVSMMRKLAYKITQREDNHLVGEISMLKINDAHIAGIVIQDLVAEIKVAFDVELISYVTDSTNKVVSGDKSKVKNIKDTWTFSRHLKSSDPTWALVSTDQMFS